MSSYLVMTLLGPDRPGLVRSVADAVSQHEGNWLESRMVRLAGQFAGVARVSCPRHQTDGLIARLRDLDTHRLTIHVAREETAEEKQEERQSLRIDVIGTDRPGILRELTTSIAAAGGNVEELTTGLESAPMAGHPLFRANGIVSIDRGSDPAGIRAAVEQLGGDFSVELL